VVAMRCEKLKDGTELFISKFVLQNSICFKK
jgi:hypothetical protein